MTYEDRGVSQFYTGINFLSITAFHSPTLHTPLHNIAAHPRTVAFSRRQCVHLGFPTTLVDSMIISLPWFYRMSEYKIKVSDSIQI